MGTVGCPLYGGFATHFDDSAQQAGIYLAVRSLDLETVPGFLAAAEGLTPDVKLGLISAIANREDLLRLLTYVETDLTPYLWYYSATRDQNSRSLQQYSAEPAQQPDLRPIREYERESGTRENCCIH